MLVPPSDITAKMPSAGQKRVPFKRHLCNEPRRYKQMHSVLARGTVQSGDESLKESGVKEGE